MEKALKRIQTGRLSLIMMIFFTVVNAIMWFFGSQYIFPYTAYTPQLTALFARLLQVKYGFNGAVAFWLLISLAIVGLYIYAWNKAKTNAKGFRLALILYVVDTLLFIITYSQALFQMNTVIAIGNNVLILPEVAFAIGIHGLILYHFYTAYKESKLHPEALIQPRMKR